jgi:hypothetical protein
MDCGLWTVDCGLWTVDHMVLQVHMDYARACMFAIWGVTLYIKYPIYPCRRYMPTEVRSRKSEVGSQKSEVGSRKSENAKSENY